LAGLYPENQWGGLEEARQMKARIQIESIRDRPQTVQAG